MIRIVTTALLGMILFTACKEKAATPQKIENGGDEIYNVEADDKAMNAAIAKAGATYPDFLKALKSPEPTAQGYAVKIKFEEGDAVEHMWLGDLHFKDGKLLGILNSDPVSIKKVSPGDTLEVDKSSLSDWMYIKNNKLMGGYTVKVLYDKMSDAEKKEFVTESGFAIE